MPNPLQNHLNQDKPKRGKRVSQKSLDEYDRVQRLIEEVQVDLVNGVLRSEIFNKFRDRQYENLHPSKNIGERQIQNYIKAAWELLREDRVEKVHELRDFLFSAYMSQYNDATKSNNPLIAKSVLDSISKIFLPDEKNINLDVKGQLDNNVTIKFGFGDGD